MAQVAMFIALYKFKSIFVNKKFKFPIFSRKHFALPDVAFWLLILFYIALVVLVVVSEVVRVMEQREQMNMTAIEMQTRSRGTTPSDSYYYHTRKGMSSKVDWTLMNDTPMFYFQLTSVRKTLFTIMASVCGGTAALLVLLILLQ